MTGILNLLMGTVRSAVVTDPYFEYTTLLLPGNGTNGAQNNTFLDGSTNNFTITRNGNTTQGTFSPFSQTGWGNYFDGTGDYLSAPANAAFELGAPSGNTNDFSIEFWCYPTGTGIYQVVGTAYGAGYWAISLNRNPSTGANNVGYVALYLTDSFYMNTTSGIVANQWNHVAAVRTGTTVSVFVNGTTKATTTSSQNPNSTGTFLIGKDTTLGRDFAGYLSNVRIVKGVTQPYSATSATIIPPTLPLTAITGTTFLSCQSNRFIDNSTNNFTITVNGSPTVVAFSPFNPTASWSAATYGGSGYFDGSGDYLSAASNTALNLTGDYTVECWFYANSFPTQPALFGIGSDAAGLVLTIVSSKVYAYFVGVGNVFGSGGTTLITNSWNHIAIVRSGTTNTCYINGSQSGTTYSSSSTISSTGGVGIGRTVTGSSFNDWNGYVADFRIVKGTAVYTGAFTPPTAPLTAITNTSLLLNFTNAGIYDATSKNDLETVGNAQISTAISAKWGSGSMAFDGNGDWLAAPTSILPQFGTGDFTIEFWWYPNSLATAQQIISNTNDSAVTGSGEFVITYNTSLGLRFYINAGAADIQQGSTTGWTTGQWYYVAAVRSGNTLTLYRNGSSIASGSVTGITIGANVPFYIGGEPTQPTSINGYLQDVRITKGYARTVTTSPTAAFPTL